MLALVLVVLAGGDLYSWRVTRNRAQDAGFEELAALSRVARSHQPDFADSAALRLWLSDVATSGAQVTVFRSDGALLADSADPSKSPAAKLGVANPNVDDGKDQAEIQQAFSKGEGRSTRHNDATDRDVLYYAVAIRPPASPAATGAPAAYVLRLALPLPDVDRQFSAMRRPVWTAFLVLLAFATGTSLLLFRGTSRRISGLTEFSRRMAAGDFRPLSVEPGGGSLDALARELNKSAARLDASIGMLTDERNRSAAILGSMIEGVAVIGEDERVIFSNRAFSQILGLADLGEIEGRPLLEVARQSDLLAAIRMALSGHQQVTSEIVVGTVRPRSFAVTAAPVQAASHKGAVLVLHEISDLRRLERVRQDFVANVSHEFRTPLTAIQGFAETLLGGALDDPANRRRFVEIIREHAMRLARLTEDLLKLSRIEAGQLKLEFRPVSVAQLVESCVETAQLKATPRNLALSVQLPDGLPAVRGDCQ